MYQEDQREEKTKITCPFKEIPRVLHTSDEFTSCWSELDHKERKSPEGRTGILSLHSR
jgi:hypothetical protein